MLRKRARTFEPSWAQVGDETKLPREEEKDQKSNKIKKENQNQIKENPKKTPKNGRKACLTLAVTSQCRIISNRHWARRENPVEMSR